MEHFPYYTIQQSVRNLRISWRKIMVIRNAKMLILWWRGLGSCFITLNSFMIIFKAILLFSILPFFFSAVGDVFCVHSVSTYIILNTFQLIKNKKFLDVTPQYRKLVSKFYTYYLPKIVFSNYLLWDTMIEEINIWKKKVFRIICFWR